MPYKIVIPQDITDVGKDFLRENGYEIIIGSGNPDPEVLKSEISQADGLLARLAPFPAEVLAAAPNLKVIGRHGVGYNNIDVDYCTKNGIVVTYTPESMTNSVAEHVISLIYAISRKLALMDRETRRGNWDIRNKERSADLEGKTLGLIGLGRIGALTAKKAALGADMKVIGYDVFLDKDNYPEHVTPAASAEEVFEQADYVSLHIPSSPQTDGMVNYALLSHMKKSAYFINGARGEVVNEADLLRVLTEGLISGAALDVFAKEPASADNPLFKLDNVIVTPHCASNTQESMDRMGLHAAEGIHAVLSGQKPRWVVNQV